MLGAGDAFMSGFLRGYLRGEPLETCCAFANAAGPSRSRACSARSNIPTFAELQHFLDASACATPPAPRRRPQPHPLGDHPRRARPRRTPIPAGSWRSPSTTACSSRPWPTRPALPRKRIEALKVLAVEAAVAGGRRPARLRHAARRHLRPGGAVPRRPTTRCGSAGRSRSRARARSTSRATARSARCLNEWPLAHTDQVPLLHASGRSGRARRPGRSASCCASTTPPARATASCWSRSSPASTAPLGDDTVARVIRAALRARHQARLVEARRPAERRRLGQRRRRHRAATIPTRAASCCSAWTRRRRSLLAAFRARRRAAPMVKGFAVGRTIFGEPARAWLAGRHERCRGAGRDGGALPAAGRRLARRSGRTDHAIGKNGNGPWRPFG